MMKRKITLSIISGVAIVVLSASTVINSGGVANWTGSPVDGGVGSGGQCSACHSGGTLTPTCSVTESPAFGGSGTSLTYVPGTTYTITVTPIGAGYARFGMNCEIINSTSTSTGAVGMFGTFVSAISGGCQIYSSTATTPYPPCVSHNSSSTTIPFNFTWTAPASGTGYLYADVLGTNNNGANTGDQVSGVTSYTLMAASSSIESHTDRSIALEVFPNPATDNIRLTYTLAERGTVMAKLYTLNGEWVADLINETQDRGLQSVGTRLPLGLAKGTYMVKLSVNGKQTLQKLMVL